MTPSEQVECGKRRVAILTISLIGLYVLYRVLYGSIWGQGGHNEGWRAWCLPGAELAMLLCIASAMTRGIRSGHWTPRDWGLGLDKTVWVVGAVLAALFALGYLFNQPESGAESMRVPLANTLELGTSEVLLRGLLVSCLLVWFGKNPTGVAGAALVSAIALTLVRWPDGGVTPMQLVGTLCLQGIMAYGCYSMGSVLVTMVFPLFPVTSEQPGTYPLFSVALYFALALVAKYVSPKEAHTETEIAKCDTT
ncbi:MAG: hypothetical protein ABIE70_01235 [bacterium]